MRRRVDRWRPLLGPAALLVTVGVLTASPTLIVAAAIPLGYVAYSSLSTVPDVRESLALRRELSTDTPYPGQRVAVELTVENIGEAAIPDLRVVDGLPSDLRPVEGEHAGVFSLRSGESVTLSYDLVGKRGAHQFDSVRIRARSTAASAVSQAVLSPNGDDDLFCRVSMEDAPVRDQTMQFAGSVPTDTGGPGIEFHSTRDYRRGDPMNRIDWRRLAKTGELTTIDYRRQEAARVMVALDARREAAVDVGDAYPTSQELVAYAGELLTDALLGEGHEVGIAAFGVDLSATPGTGSPAVLEPGGGETFRAHAKQVCSAVAESGSADSSVRADGDGDRDAEVDRLRGYVDQHTQVLFVTPAIDDFAEDATRLLEGHGHRVTVVSPDVTATETVGTRLAHADRRLRVDRIRELGALVVDWDLDDPLPLALAPAFRAVVDR